MPNALGVPSPDKAAYMDDVARAAVGYKRQMLTLLELEPGLTVLDLGCGPGADIQSMADAVTTSGRVVGVDIDPRMVEAASARFHDHPHVEIRLGDGHTLPFEDATFDRARMDRALQHVADPAVVLSELLRVLKPGGLLRVGEPDWDSLTVDGDLEMNRAFNRFVCSTMVRNATIGRRLARLARGAGFEVQVVRTASPVFHDFALADNIFAFTRNTERAIRAGAIDRADGERWLAELQSGDFLAAPLVFLLSARKPL
ncbi:methyltransferase domain-containing protein [Lentzea nigeriaca]|uniref:methyltransferase domain-containing protein n=1 Tax=Lentzea nigeriaca TaxID=1128665 RepID=UPI00195A0BAE|nr:methyltransferase domain-containing protein [Lentzea nigeriaca]MBM7859798.1 ubiquinone/menaquinone biosynthesis C-methylase UbiE [Lentzea nigeriaca]